MQSEIIAKKKLNIIKRQIKNLDKTNNITLILIL